MVSGLSNGLPMPEAHSEITLRSGTDQTEASLFLALIRMPPPSSFAALDGVMYPRPGRRGSDLELLEGATLRGS